MDDVNMFHAPPSPLGRRRTATDTDTGEDALKGRQSGDLKHLRTNKRTQTLAQRDTDTDTSLEHLGLSA